MTPETFLLMLSFTLFTAVCALVNYHIKQDSNFKFLTFVLYLFGLFCMFGVLVYAVFQTVSSIK